MMWSRKWIHPASDFCKNWSPQNRQNLPALNTFGIKIHLSNKFIQDRHNFTEIRQFQNWQADFHFQNYIFITKNPDFALICSVSSFKSVKIDFKKATCCHFWNQPTSRKVAFLKTSSILKGTSSSQPGSSMKHPSVTGLLKALPPLFLPTPKKFCMPLTFEFFPVPPNFHMPPVLFLVAPT